MPHDNGVSPGPWVNLGKIYSSDALKRLLCFWKISWGWKVQSASNCFNYIIWTLLFSACIYSHGSTSAFCPPYFAKTIWPGSDSFLYSYPPQLLELIPLYGMYPLSSLLFPWVSSLPTLRDWVMQPEHYGTASCSLLFSPHVSPTVLSGIWSVSALQREWGNAAGHLNKVWQEKSRGILFALSS